MKFSLHTLINLVVGFIIAANSVVYENFVVLFVLFCVLTIFRCALDIVLFVLLSIRAHATNIAFLFWHPKITLLLASTGQMDWQYSPASGCWHGCTLVSYWGHYGRIILVSVWCRCLARASRAFLQNYSLSHKLNQGLESVGKVISLCRHVSGLYPL